MVDLMSAGEQAFVMQHGKAGNVDVRVANAADVEEIAAGAAQAGSNAALLSV